MENCEDIQYVPFSVAIDTLMHCFRKLVDRLYELKIIADKNIEKAYAVAHEMLNEWFRQQGEFFWTFIGKLQSDMNDLLSPSEMVRICQGSEFLFRCVFESNG